MILTKSVGYLLYITALKKVNVTFGGNMRTRFKNAGFHFIMDIKYLISFAYIIPGNILLNGNNQTYVNLGI